MTVRLSGASGRVVTVSYATTDGTASSPADYTAGSGTLTFAAGEIAKTISVSVAGDTVDEPDETFAVNLSAPVNATIADTQGIVTIVDNDPIPVMTIDDLATTESDSGGLVASVTVRLSRASDRLVTVSYSTADVTAATPADYTATSGALTFAAGEMTKTISVSVSGRCRRRAGRKFRRQPERAGQRDHR